MRQERVHLEGRRPPDATGRGGQRRDHLKDLLHLLLRDALWDPVAGRGLALAGHGSPVEGAAGGGGVLEGAAAGAGLAPYPEGAAPFDMTPFGRVGEHL